ncbi:MAG: type II toxin-antitoxin system VapC family toxin [Acidobacteria bacterium]|nr:type II toxin-antitoxin system VapC family toxin [Acidobacteriota bacterium]
MPFVLDASVAACWAFQDEDHPQADLALAQVRADEAVAPALLWYEVRNILIVNERRKRLTESGTRAFLHDLSKLPIRVDRMPDEGQVLRLARTHRLSVYDAVYLELAQRESLHLATLDVDLAKAALAEGVPLLGENRTVV